MPSLAVSKRVASPQEASQSEHAHEPDALSSREPKSKYPESSAKTYIRTNGVPSQELNKKREYPGNKNTK